MAKDVTFQLDTIGGAIVLQQMTKPIVDSTAKRISERATQIASKVGVGSGTFRTTTGVGAGNKRGGTRYYARIEGKSQDQASYNAKYEALQLAARSIRVR